MKKRYIFLGLCAVIIIMHMITPDRKQHTIKKVEKNLEVYAKVAHQILESKTDTEKITLKGIKDIAMWNDVQIDFTCNMGGFASATWYSGFYYSVDDVPRTFQGYETQFQKYEDGLKWQQPEGDNWCYVEKIYDHWYYFEMHF